MEIVFELREDQVKLYDRRLIYKFLDNLVESIKKDIKDALIPAKFEMLERGLLNANWIRWKTKQSGINISKLVDRILSCITWQERKTSFRIYIDPKMKMPYTVNTSLERVARFLDKGNNVSKHSTMFSRVFNYYQKNINEFWKAYLEVGYILDGEGEDY